MTTQRKPPAKSRPRREKGTGSITRYEIKAGTRWRYEIEVPLDSDQPQIGTRSHSRAGFASYEEANDELTVLRADLIRKVPQVIGRGRDTFGGYGQRWLDGHSCGNGTRLYIQRVIDAMHPYIGPVRLSDIRATDLAAAYRGLERGTKQVPSPKRPRQGLATSTVARYASWVNTIFLAALDEGLIIKNPANSKHAGRPKGESAKRVKPFTIWNVEQLTGFCDWAIAEDEPWARAWVLLSRTGLRSGELLGQGATHRRERREPNPRRPRTVHAPHHTHPVRPDPARPGTPTTDAHTRPTSHGPLQSPRSRSRDPAPPTSAPSPGAGSVVEPHCCRFRRPAAASPSGGRPIATQSPRPTPPASAARDR